MALCSVAKRFTLASDQLNARIASHDSDLVWQVWKEPPLMPSIPALYLKWRAFKELVGEGRPDAQIAEIIFGPRDAPVKLHRLLHGDARCEPDVAAQFVKDIINPCIHSRKNLRPSRASQPNLLPSELFLPVYDFTRRVIAALGGADAEALERAHSALLAELVPRVPGQAPRLTIERFAPPKRISSSRSFSSTRASGGEGPVEFRAERDRGRLVIEDTSTLPSAAYVHFIRDPAPLGHHLWELKWGDTVLWQPSPFSPIRAGGVLALMPEPEPFQAMPGRFFVTAVLVLDKSAQRDLDPRGADWRSAALDEQETARYLTNVRRLAKRNPSPIAVTTTEYIVIT
jgi:hypothetical protein